MASQKNFAITPSVSISRSKFRRPSQHKTSFQLGKIVPIYVDADILPGDTVSLDLASLVRMSNPIFPLMDNVFIDYYAFFTPNRLVWDQWKQFMGENTSSFGAASEPNFPGVDISNASGHAITTGSLGDYFGLPVGLTGTSSLMVSALPGRAYYLIYNEWFRDQNLIAPIDVLKSSANNSIYTGDSDYNSALCVAAKESDYFTRALPYAQKGSPVTLPLGTEAPILGKLTSVSGLGTSTWSDLDGMVLNTRVSRTGTAAPKVGDTINVDTDTNDGSGVNQIATGNLYADLSNATAATINQLRFAFQYQKFLEKDALYGSRYWEILKGHFGITAPDASLQRPELLGHFRQHINIDQVLQTTGAAPDDTSTLGAPGANSVSGKSEHLISKSFVEHGVLMILAVARHDQTYGQGINRMWSRAKRTDFYFPVFANLGSQDIKRKEIYATGVANNDNSVFGYQEAWAEYRYKPSIVSGLLNPSVANSMAPWTLANNFGSAPTLSKSFIEQDRTSISRCLVTGSDGPDFIADFYFDAVYVRPMPMYSIPGLIDHH